MNRVDIQNYKNLLGLRGIEAAAFDATAATLAANCPNTTVAEAQQCLFENLINCPEGVLLDFMQLICRVSTKVQAALIARTHKVVDKTFFYRFNVPSAAPSTAFDPFGITDMKTLVGVNNFADKGALPNDLPFSISAIQLKYGEKVYAVGATVQPTDAGTIQYGLIETTNTVAGAAALNTRRVKVDPIILNSQFNLKYGNTFIFNNEPLSFMSDYSINLNKIGYKKINNIMLCEGTDSFSFELKSAIAYAPVITTAAVFLELQMHGAAVIKLA